MVTGAELEPEKPHQFTRAKTGFQDDGFKKSSGQDQLLGVRGLAPPNPPLVG